MNKLQIIGFILITIGTIISFIGSYNQSKRDDIFQNKLTEYVEKQTKSEVPVIKALKIEGAKSENPSILIKNVGKATAKNLKLILALIPLME